MKTLVDKFERIKIYYDDPLSDGSVESLQIDAWRSFQGWNNSFKPLDCKGGRDGRKAKSTDETVVGFCCCLGFFLSFFLDDPLLVLDDDVAEEEAARFTDGSQTALDARAEELLCAAAVDHEDTEAWRDLPDMCEGDHGKLAAPAKSQRDAAQDGKHIVAASLATVEALVGVPPHAVGGVGSFRFCQHVLKGHLCTKKKKRGF